VTEPAGETGALDVPEITAPVGCAMNCNLVAIHDKANSFLIFHFQIPARLAL